MKVSQTMKMVPMDEIKPHPENPRRGNLGAIEASIRANGFYGALLVQKSTGFIVAGNHRFLAARNLGLEQVPVILADLSDEQARRVLLADNRTSDLGGYDERSLADLLLELDAEGSLDGTGYDEEVLKQLVEKLDEAGPDSFPSYDPDSMVTEHECPKCGYQWSGKS